MLRHIFLGLCRKSSGRLLVASAIGVLTGVECLMATRSKAQPKPAAQPKTASPPKAIRSKPAAQAPAPRADYFSIRRTKSELGYTYWVLQGFGKYRSFALFDTWQEAMDEASVRLKAGAAVQEQLVAAR